MIADMGAETHAARLLAWQSAWMLDNGVKNTLVSSDAKRLAADMGMKATTDAVQIYEGTSQAQRLIIARAPPKR